MIALARFEGAEETVTFRTPKGNAAVGAIIDRPFATVSVASTGRADATTVSAIIHY